MPSDSQTPRDVRMRGFERRSSVAEVRDWIDRQVISSPDEIARRVEVVPLKNAYQRVLATDLVSPLAVPGFDRSAMDGYALRAESTIGASDYSPCTFRVVGESLPGRPAMATVGPGEAVRIMTGAPLPEGADAVVPVELTRPAASTHASQQACIEVTAAIAGGKNIGRKGEDVTREQTVLKQGRRLRPQDLGVAASLGIATLDVIRKPRVRLIVTGDELVPPGEPLGPFQIHEANSYMLQSLVARDGGNWLDQLNVKDDRETLKSHLIASAADADVLLISGGSSVGAEDHAPSLIAELGELAHHGIAMRPSSPAGVGRIAQTLVFLLPGNPVSCLCAYDFFAGRAIRRLGGGTAVWPYRMVQLLVIKKIVSAVGRVDYCRVRVDEVGVSPIALTGASILTSTTKADGFLVIPAESEGYGPGSIVEVYLYDDEGMGTAIG